MEYLMTYGWAILIIAIVLGVLYYLGVFGGAVTAPRAQPGNCQVYRPNGPGTSTNIGLSGVCNNELPEYVASFSGLSPGIFGPTITANLNTQSYTYCGWADVLAYQPNSYGDVIVAISYAQTGLVTNPTSSSVGVESYISGSSGRKNGAPYGAWNFYCVVYQGLGSTSRSDYINGTLVGTDTTGTANSFTGPIRIGNKGSTCCGFTTNPPDYLSNIQIYNTSLSANEIEGLYLEGIGGAPVNPAYLIGWWPLNGNPNDYSGNMNNGVATSVNYTSSWSSEYTGP